MASRPTGWVGESDFRTRRAAAGEPARDGEVLVRNLFLSLDPYMRGAHERPKSYAAGVELDAVMVGGTVGEVMEIAQPGVQGGRFRGRLFGWQQLWRERRHGCCARSPAATSRLALSRRRRHARRHRVDRASTKIGQPKAGETVVVSAASGAVGSVVGQLAKMQGCRVGRHRRRRAESATTSCRSSASTPASTTRPATSLHDLARQRPKGIDVYFENVGGAVLDAVIPRTQRFARIPLCGLDLRLQLRRRRRACPTALQFLVKRVQLHGLHLLGPPWSCGPRR